MWVRKRIEVIADDESEMCVVMSMFWFFEQSKLHDSVEASTRMVKNYDFVITSGGIGPTHDGAC